MAVGMMSSSGGSSAGADQVFALIALITDKQACAERLSDLLGRIGTCNGHIATAQAAIDQAARDREAADARIAEADRKAADAEAVQIAFDRNSTDRQAALDAREVELTTRETAAVQIEQKNAADRQALDETIAKFKSITV